MTIFNRRNAAIGWLVWGVGKRFGKRKAREAMPDRKAAGAAAGGLAALGGLFAFLRLRRRSGGDGD